MFIEKCFSSSISNLQNARFVFMAGERVGVAPKTPDPINPKQVRADAEAGIQAAKEGIKTDIDGHKFDAKTIIAQHVTDINVIAGAAFNSFGEDTTAHPLLIEEKDAKKAIEKMWQDALDAIKSNENFYYGFEKYVDKKTEITVMLAKNADAFQLLQTGGLDAKKAQALFDTSAGWETSSKELLDNLLLSGALLATEYKADYDGLNVQIQAQKQQFEATANGFINTKQQVIDAVGAANKGLTSNDLSSTETAGHFRTIMDQGLALEILISQLQSANITDSRLVQLRTKALTQKAAVDATLAKMKIAFASTPEAKTQFDKLLAAKQNYLTANAQLDKTQNEGVINERHTNAVIQATTWQAGADGAYKGLLEQMIVALPKAKNTNPEGATTAQV